MSVCGHFLYGGLSIVSNAIAMVVVCTTIGALGAAGCNGENGGSTRDKAAFDYLVRDLGNRREGASRGIDSGHTDPLIVSRLDAALEALQELGSSAIKDAPRLFYAIVREEPYPNMMGADFFRLWALVPLANPIKSVEIRDPEGNTVATAGKWVSAWDVRAEEPGIGTIVLMLYLAPSVYDPPDAEPSPWVKEGFVPHGGHIAPTEGEGYDVVRLPDNWNEMSLEAYLVFEDGKESDGAAIWIMPRFED